MAAEGHQVGLHTYDHVELKGLSRREFDFQVSRAREGSYWLRPPYGLIDKAAEDWCGGPIILWSVDPEDWKYKDAERVRDYVVKHVKDGDIILPISSEYVIL